MTNKPLREALDDWPEPEGSFDEVLERAAQDRFGQPEPTLTASEVKVLTETATKVAYALGRKDAGEEIATAIAAEYVPVHNVGGAEPIPSDPTEWDEALHVAVQIARKLSSQPAGAASDATSVVPGHQEVSDILGGSGAPLRRDATYPVDDDHPEHCLCPTCREVSVAVRSPQEPCGHPTCPCASQEAR